jgi:hypothetical protein
LCSLRSFVARNSRAQRAFLPQKSTKSTKKESVGFAFFAFSRGKTLTHENPSSLKAREEGKRRRGEAPGQRGVRPVGADVLPYLEAVGTEVDQQSVFEARGLEVAEELRHMLVGCALTAATRRGAYSRPASRRRTPQSACRLPPLTSMSSLPSFAAKKFRPRKAFLPQEN